MMRILQIKEKIYDEMVGTKVNRSLDADKTIEITIGEAHGPVKSILKSLSCWVDPLWPMNLSIWWLTSK